MGIIGTGKPGVSDICAGFGMKILGYDPSSAKDSNTEYVKLEELFRRSDIISFMPL